MFQLWLEHQKVATMRPLAARATDLAYMVG
jgi:asparagine synthase (glutamine-hydrolysing)